MRTLAATLLLAAVGTLLAAPKPSSDAMRRYTRELDRLERLAYSIGFDERFWRESKRVADRSGPEIVHAVLPRSHSWEGEEGLIFVPLVALLPREPTLKLLRQYQRSPHELERIWAGEFITEFDMSDTKEGVRRFAQMRPN